MGQRPELFEGREDFLQVIRKTGSCLFTFAFVLLSIKIPARGKIPCETGASGYCCREVEELSTRTPLPGPLLWKGRGRWRQCHNTPL
jgi:hypothetical protein